MNYDYWATYFLCCRYNTVIFRVNDSKQVVTITHYGPTGQMSHITLPPAHGGNMFLINAFYSKAECRIAWDALIALGYKRVHTPSEIEHPAAFVDAVMQGSTNPPYDTDTVKDAQSVP